LAYLGKLEFFIDPWAIDRDGAKRAEKAGNNVAAE